jgi:FMN-dependent NADH-azoreductase
MILFINAAFRNGSRTFRLASHYMKRYSGDDIITVELGDEELTPLNRQTLKTYNRAVKQSDYADGLFSVAKQFAQADEIIIAAPFWNFSIPAVLHTYLELACTQGVNFDVSENGSYYTLCKAKKLVYITTAGGYIPQDDHAFGYIKTLAEIFWGIGDIEYYKADGIDIIENDAERILSDTEAEMDK